MGWEDSPGQAAFRQDVRTFIQRLPGVRPPAEGGRRPRDRLAARHVPRRTQGEPGRPRLDRRPRRARLERPHWPKEYGGLSTIEQFIFKQELALAMPPELGGANGVGQFGATLLVHGTEEQKKKFLPPDADR